MKARGRFMLLIMLVIAAALSFVSYQGIGEGKILSAGNIKQGLDLSGGVYIVYEADKEDVTAEEMQAAVSLIQGRMDWNGWTEAEVAQEGTNRIRVDIPGVENAEEAIREIGQTAQLSFVDETGKVLLTGDMVADATKQVGAIQKGGNAQPYVALKFNDEGKQLFAEATAANIGKPIYIVMDGEVISAPMVQSAITTGEASITGNFTGESAEELASLIRAGSLPFNLNVIQMKNVGARLGADALATGVKAGAIGLALVLIFMLVVYKVLGFAADLALIIYVGLELILLNAFNITLTLPGIAGIHQKRVLPCAACYSGRQRNNTHCSSGAVLPWLRYGQRLCDHTDHGYHHFHVHSPGGNKTDRKRLDAGRMQQPEVLWHAQ